MKNIIFLLSFVPFISFSQSQNQADSLQKIWRNKSETAKKRFAAYEGYYQLLISADPLKIVHSSVSHLELALKEKSKNETLLAYGNKAAALSFLAKSDEAIRTLELAYDFAKQQNDSVSMAKNQMNRGTIYSQTGNYKEAVRNYMESLAFFKAKKMDFPQSVVLNNLGDVFNEINDYKQSLNYYNQSLSLLEKLGTADDSEYTWIRIAVAHYQLGSYKKAKIYIDKTLKILKNRNNKIIQSECQYYLALLYRKKGETEKAIESAKKSINLSLEMGINNSIISYKTLYAELLLKNDVLTATKIGEEALALLDNQTPNRTKVPVYNLLYKCYKKQDETNLSFAMLEMYSIWNDSLKFEKNGINITREAIQKEFAEKLKKTKLKNEKVQADLKFKQTKRLFTLILSSLLLIVLIFIFFRRKIANDSKLREKLLNEIKELKNQPLQATSPAQAISFHLDREKLETKINRKLNETDWTVLNILTDDPVISNPEIAKKAFLSIDGIGSSLRRMYDYFEIKESKYKKISLLLEAIKISNQ